MKHITSFLRNCVRECPFRFRCTIMAMSVLLAAILVGKHNQPRITLPANVPLYSVAKVSI